MSLPATLPVQTVRSPHPHWSDAIAAAGAPTVFWGRGDVDEWAVGFGVWARHAAAGLAEGYDALARIFHDSVVEESAAGVPPMPGPWFGGFAFPTARMEGLWSAFPTSELVAPEVLVWRRARQTWRSTLGPRPLPTNVPVTPRSGRAVSSSDGDERARWQSLVDRALARLGERSLHKVVAARALDVTLESEVDVMATLRRLLDRHPTCRVFLHAASDATLFLGATPELLCAVQGAEVRCDALAGTVAPGQAFGAKEELEHRAVEDFLVAALGTVSPDVTTGARGARRLANVQHLHSEVRGTLRPGTRLDQVLSLLHPTPAVGGTPTAAALDFIDEHEGLDRGWYSGAMGAVGPGRADFHVALRCAVVARRRVRAFAGAGLVPGSTPDGEWVETERKSRAVLDAICGGAHGNR